MARNFTVIKARDIKNRPMFIASITPKVVKVIAGDSEFHYYDRFTGLPYKLRGRFNKAASAISAASLEAIAAIESFESNLRRRVNGHGNVAEYITEYTKASGNYTNWLRKMNVTITEL